VTLAAPTRDRSIVFAWLARAFLLVGVFGVLGVVGCSGLPTVRFTPPFGRSDWIGLADAEVVVEPSPALAVTFTNERARRLWIRIEIDEIEGRNDCTNSFVLEPDQSHRYSCPQLSVAERTRYRAEILVFSDRANKRQLERLRRRLEILRDDEGRLVLAGRPAR